MEQNDENNLDREGLNRRIRGVDVVCSVSRWFGLNERVREA